MVDGLDEDAALALGRVAGLLDDGRQLWPHQAERCDQSNLQKPYQEGDFVGPPVAAPGQVGGTQNEGVMMYGPLTPVTVGSTIAVRATDVQAESKLALKVGDNGPFHSVLSSFTM